MAKKSKKNRFENEDLLGDDAAMLAEVVEAALALDDEARGLTSPSAESERQAESVPQAEASPESIPDLEANSLEKTAESSEELISEAEIRARSKKSKKSKTRSVSEAEVLAREEAAADAVDAKALEEKAHENDIGPSSAEEGLTSEAEVLAHEEQAAASVTEEISPAMEASEEPEKVVTQKITDLAEIEQAVEALIFAAPKAMSHQRLRAILHANNFDTSALPDVLKSIEHAYIERGFNLVKVAGGYQFRSHPKHADILEKLVEDKPQRLSTSALEVLAIVAYKQPVTRAEIDAVRGVDSGHLLRGLLEKNLARTEGHAETTGRPLLYGTTPYFLEIFGLNSLDDLPALEEFQRELVEKAESAEGDASASLEAALLAADPGLSIDNSGLAANPDRGRFDEPAEERFEEADFGLLANENAAATNEDDPPPNTEVVGEA